MTEPDIDSTEPLAQATIAVLRSLQADVAALTERLTRLERRDTAQYAPVSPQELDDAVAAVRAHEEAENAPWDLYEARRRLSLHPTEVRRQTEVLNAAIAQGRLFQRRVGNRHVVTASPRADDDMASLLAYLDHQPATRSEILRSCIGKNRLPALVERGVRDGLLRLGTLDTQTSGRRPQVIGRADQPVPTHLDGQMVRWQR